MSQGKSSRNRTQKPVSPRQKQLSVSSETSDEEYLQKWIQCDKCECWDIIENAGSSMKTDIENGKSNDVDNEDFICRVCKLTIRLEDAIIEIKIARDENKTLQNKVSEMEKKLQDRDKEIKGFFIFAAKSSEDEQQKKRNIILYRVKESISSDSGTRTKEDLCFVKKLIVEGLKLENNSVNIVKLHRLGKRTEDQQNKSRPLLVQFSSIEDKEKVMKNVGKLKAAESFRTVSLAHDLTPQQREELRDEIKKAKEKASSEVTAGRMSENFKIRVVGPAGKLRVVIKKNEGQGVVRI